MLPGNDRSALKLVSDNFVLPVTLKTSRQGNLMSRLVLGSQFLQSVNISCLSLGPAGEIVYWNYSMANKINLI